MKYKIHIVIEIVAALICLFWVTIAIYGINTLFEISNAPSTELDEFALSGPYFNKNLLYLVGVILGSIGIFWGLIQRFRKKEIKQHMFFKSLLVVGILAASVMMYEGMSFTGDDALMYFPIFIPIYVAIIYIGNFSVFITNRST